MLSSITPLGERGRNNRWSLTVASYMAASRSGGAATGVVLGGVGEVVLRALPSDPVSVQVRLLALALIAAAGVVVDLGLVGARVPTLRRQVDEQWIGRYRGWVYGAGFGFQLGAGVVTVVTSAIVWVALAAALLSASWEVGLVLGVVFGVVRSLPVLLTAPVRSPAALHVLHQRNQRWARAGVGLAIVGQALTIGGAVVLASTATS
ncbi:MAG: hypothetical protein WKF43_09065 [Acidimicrobiales bacterium]